MIKEDGSRVGDKKTENARTDLTHYGATFEWDYTTNNWKGIERADTVYNALHQNTKRTIYDWSNGDWSAKTQYTYAFDNPGFKEPP